MDVLFFCSFNMVPSVGKAATCFWHVGERLLLVKGVVDDVVKAQTIVLLFRLPGSIVELPD